MNAIPSTTLLSILIVILTTNLDAKESASSKQWGQCTNQERPLNSTYSDLSDNLYPDAIYLEANSGIINRNAVSTLQGKVIIKKNDILFKANNASFNKKNSLVTADGDVILKTNNLEFKSQSIRYNLKDNTGTVKQTEYKVGSQNAHGNSKQVKLINKDELELNQATFSTCPARNPSWYIKSSKIKLNNKAQLGTAKDITFNVGGLPIFYFPSFSFPLNNNRKSGFLSPSLRVQSDKRISLPYYLNLAPNYDATITTSIHERQGLEIDTEFRYLTQQHQGVLKYDFIPKDKSFNNKRRDYFNVEHHTTISKETTINLKAEGVSDNNYFNDLSNSLENSSRSSLQRRLEIIHKVPSWEVSAAVEDYQILDTKNSPYAKLPEIKLSYKPKTSPKALKLTADLEFINFEKENATTGFRSDFKISASKKWGTDAWYIKPTLSIESTLYSLKNTIGDSTLSRTLPTFTLDSGMYFDREITLQKRKGKRKYTQTLEPRFYYSYTPFKDQSNFPIFDTARTDFSATTQLFSENRFTGKDRIGDTNQVTFAVSSRLQDREDGKELLRASIGQVINFSNRKVTLPNSSSQLGRRSDLVLELSGRLNENFRISSTILWNHKEKHTSNYELRLNYQDEKKRIANISYRKLNTEFNQDDNKLSQFTISTALPINDKWSFVGSYERDIENKRNLETLIGLEYQDCCWKTRIVAKRYLSSDNVNYENPIFLEFELKGLGSLGSGAKREIKEKIYGYEDY